MASLLFSFYKCSKTTPFSSRKDSKASPKLHTYICNCLTVLHRLPQFRILNCTHHLIAVSPQNGPSFTNSATQEGKPVLLDFSDPSPPSPAPRWLILHLISLSSSSFTLLPLWARLLLLTYGVSLVSRFSCLFSVLYLYSHDFNLSSRLQPECEFYQSKASIYFMPLCPRHSARGLIHIIYNSHSIHSYTHLPSKETEFHRWWYPDSWALEKDPLWLCFTSISFFSWHIFLAPLCILLSGNSKLSLVSQTPCAAPHFHAILYLCPRLAVICLSLCVCERLLDLAHSV